MRSEERRRGNQYQLVDGKHHLGVSVAAAAVAVAVAVTVAAFAVATEADVAEILCTP